MIRTDNIICLLLCVFRNVVCRLATVTSLSTTAFRTVRHTFTPIVGHYVPAVTSQSLAAASRPCTASTTRSILSARSVSVSSTRAHSRRRMINRTAIRALCVYSADQPNDSFFPSCVRTFSFML